MNNITVVTENQSPVWAVAPVWMLDYSDELVNENRTGKRDASGKFLKLHVALNTVAKSHSAANVEMAAKFNVDSDELFAGSR